LIEARFKHPVAPDRPGRLAHGKVFAVAWQLLQNRGMRGFVIFLIIAGFGFLFWRQRESQTPSAPASANAVATQSAAPAATPAPLTPAPRGQASKYNFMKRDLDRARDVVDQSRARTQAAQNPAP
jgi:hypothetical protein